MIEKNHLIILDFDGTLYKNSSSLFDIDINIGQIVDAHLFFKELSRQINLFDKYELCHNTVFFLATGRPICQKFHILSILQEKSYRIDKAFFSNYDFSLISQPFSQYERNQFFIEYWKGKVSLINELYNSENFKSITVVDNDDVICEMLKKMDLTIVQAKITIISNQNHIFFNLFNCQSNLKSYTKGGIMHE